MLISLYSLLFSFPAPILLALLLNELRSNKFQALRSDGELPAHFISVMVVCGMIIDFTRSDGLINDIVARIWRFAPDNVAQPGDVSQYIHSLRYLAGRGLGLNIYLSALTSIDAEQYEAAVIDGAGRLQKVLHVTLPGIAPTIVIMLIMRIGQIMNVGYEKIILLYNGNTYETADVISSFVYRKGLIEADYGYSTAIGLFNSSINLLLLLIANTVSRKVSETSLW